MLATEKVTEPRVDVDAWWTLGTAARTPRLHSCRCRSSSLHKKITRTGASCSTSEKAKGGVGVTGIAVQLSGRFGPGLDALPGKLAGYKRAITKAAGRDGGRPLQNGEKLLSVALARYTAATILSATGHKALRGT